MKQKRHTTEEIIRIIREAASDKDARKYRELEKENGELKQMLAEQPLGRSASWRK